MPFIDAAYRRCAIAMISDAIWRGAIIGAGDYR
jgi:hypothetical protein